MLSHLALSLAVSRGVYFDTQGAIERGPAPTSAPRVFLPVHAGKSLIEGAAGAYGAALLSETQVAPLAEEEGSVLACVGRASASTALARRAAGVCGCAPGDASLWLLDVSHREAPPVLPGGAWLPIRGGAGAYSVLEGLADDDEAAALASARGMGLWHRSVPHCSKCGAKTEAKRAGRARQCTSGACGARFRPRLEPSILVLVTHGDKACLGRQKSWPAGRYSTLAGFVELGESLEEAVVREVKEEVGLTVRRDSLRYVASQPWLFPASLLVGFLAEADGAELSVDEAELEAARWFGRDEIAARYGVLPEPDDGALHVPSYISLAHTVVGAWLDQTAGGARG